MSSAMEAAEARRKQAEEAAAEAERKEAESVAKGEVKAGPALPGRRPDLTEEDQPAAKVI